MCISNLGERGTSLPLLTYCLREKQVFFPIAQYSWLGKFYKMLTDFDFFRFQVLASAIVSVENGLPYKLKEKQKCALATLGKGDMSSSAYLLATGKASVFPYCPVFIRDFVNLKNANGFRFLSISSTGVSYRFIGKRASLQTKGEAEVCISNLGERGTSLPLLTYCLREKRVFFPIAQYSWLGKFKKC